ncbi:MAG: alpha/beta hydrolase [Gemmataceae bacterium]|nr:alpha/beta hydrolase [Gemmataceae bacterium]
MTAHDAHQPDAPARAKTGSLAGASGLSEALQRFEREATHGVCDTGRYRCRYHAWGQGPPLVFIPGLCDDALSFVLPMTLLSRHFHCIAYDLPTGQGDGARLGRYRHADLVADLFALLDHVGARRAYLFGSSFGSTVALAALHAQPERLPRAVLQGGFAYRPLAWAEVGLAHFARYWSGPLRWLPLRQQILFRNHGSCFRGLPPEVWGYYLQRSGSTPMTALAHRALLLHRTDLRPLLPQIRQPILLICGDCDPLVGPGCERVLLAGLPDSTRAEITHCGHEPMFTHPEAVAELVYRFLTPLPGAPAGNGAVCAHSAHALADPA